MTDIPESILLSILLRFYSIAPSNRNSSSPVTTTFNPIKVLFYPWDLPDYESVLQLSILLRFYSISILPDWRWFKWITFNPIKVLFYLMRRVLNELPDMTFNPIKVLFYQLRWWPAWRPVKLSILLRFYSIYYVWQILLPPNSFQSY